MLSEIDNIVKSYCAEIGLPYEVLMDFGQKHGKGKKKVHNGIDISKARNSLCYYLIDQFPHISTTQITRRVGYRCHSVWSKQWRIVWRRIKDKDKTFYPYYKTLLNVTDRLRENQG